MSSEEREYHRRRSALELEQAIAATSPESAIAHLELARMHRVRRLARATSNSIDTDSVAPIFRTDKEG